MSNLDPNITLYYAVPVKVPGTQTDNSLERCFYFDRGWFAIEANALKDSMNQNFVAITQVEPSAIPPRVVQYIATEAREINPGVSLFSAVAKTLGGTAAMTNLFLARMEEGKEGKSWTVVIPVAPQTRRGVILVFQTPAEGPAVQLIATSDPEVEAGSSD